LTLKWKAIRIRAHLFWIFSKKKKLFLHLLVFVLNEKLLGLAFLKKKEEVTHVHVKTHFLYKMDFYGWTLFYGFLRMSLLYHLVFTIGGDTHFFVWVSCNYFFLLSVTSYLGACVLYLTLGDSSLLAHLVRGESLRFWAYITFWFIQ